MKRQYELTVVLPSSFDEKDTKKAEDAVKKLAGDGVTIVSLASLGKKSLAYPIKKQTEGLFVTAQLEAKGLISSELEKKAKLGSDVLRFVLIAK